MSKQIHLLASFNLAFLCSSQLLGWRLRKFRIPLDCFSYGEIIRRKLLILHLVLPDPPAILLSSTRQKCSSAHVGLAIKDVLISPEPSLCGPPPEYGA